MSKSILVIDTPKRCSECELRTGDGEMFCIPTGKYLWDYMYKYDGCHPQCPLQDTTELLEALKQLDEEVDWSQSNIDWEETCLKLYKALGVE